MKKIPIEFSEKERKELRKLITELDAFYEEGEKGEAQVWNFSDLDAQREIAIDISNILRNKF
jgi:hypothetical protein